MDGETVETLSIKVGPWGGSRGVPFDIIEEPKRLVSVTARVGTFVSSFGFSYVDPAGRKHTVGPVGGNGGKLVTIQFEPTEYVKEFSGSVGLTKGTWIVTYLRIETNLKSYELYDEGTDLFQSLPGFLGILMPEKQIPFSVPVPENTSIVGFFGRAGGDNLDAIGVYVKMKSANTNTEQETGINLDDYSPEEPIFMVAEAVPIKIGAWGGDGGTEFDVTEPPKRLESMTVRAGDSVDSIGFSYVDEEGQKHSVGPFGGTGGQPTTIEFAAEEYVRKFSGTIFRSFVASLEIETNIKTYGPYGKAHNDYPFSIPLPENVSIVGFFGRAGKFLDAIGVYIGYSRSPFTDATGETSSDKDEEATQKKATASTEPETITAGQQTFPIKIGVWGLGEGIEFDVTEPPKRLDSVMIQAGDIIDSFGFSYTDQAGKKHTVGPSGGRGGSLTTIQLEPTEYVKHFSGTTGTYVGSPVVASLKIETNLGVYGPYGKEQSVPFSIPLPKNASVVGFFGLSDNLLGAIGVYVGGSIPN